MSCEVDSLPFQSHANYGTWSIDFDYYCLRSIALSSNYKCSNPSEAFFELACKDLSSFTDYLYNQVHLSKIHKNYI